MLLLQDKHGLIIWKWELLEELNIDINYKNASWGLFIFFRDVTFQCNNFDSSVLEYQLENQGEFPIQAEALCFSGSCNTPSSGPCLNQWGLGLTLDTFQTATKYAIENLPKVKVTKDCCFFILTLLMLCSGRLSINSINTCEY